MGFSKQQPPFQPLLSSIFPSIQHLPKRPKPASGPWASAPAQAAAAEAAADGVPYICLTSLLLQLDQRIKSNQDCPWQLTSLTRFLQLESSFGRPLLGHSPSFNGSKFATLLPLGIL